MQELLIRYKEIAILSQVAGLLGWDSEVNMPPKAARGRGEQAALLTGLIVDRWNEPGFKKLLEKSDEPFILIVRGKRAELQDVLFVPSKEKRVLVDAEMLEHWSMSTASSSRTKLFSDQDSEDE